MQGWNFTNYFKCCSNAEEGKPYLKPTQDKVLNWVPDGIQKSSINSTNFKTKGYSKMRQMKERYLMQNLKFDYDQTDYGTPEEETDMQIYAKPNVKVTTQKSPTKEKDQEKQNGDGDQTPQTNTRRQEIPQEEDFEIFSTPKNNKDQQAITRTMVAQALLNATASTTKSPKQQFSGLEINEELRNKIMNNRDKYPDWIFQLGALPSKQASGNTAIGRAETLTRDTTTLQNLFPEPLQTAHQQLIGKLTVQNSRAADALFNSLQKKISRRWIGAICNSIKQDETIAKPVRDHCKTFLNSDWNKWYDTAIEKDSRHQINANTFQQFNNHANALYAGQRSVNLDQISANQGIYRNRSQDRNYNRSQSRERNFNRDRSINYGRNRSEERYDGQYESRFNQRSNNGRYNSNGSINRDYDRNRSREYNRNRSRDQSFNRNRSYSRDYNCNRSYEQGRPYDRSSERPSRRDDERKNQFQESSYKRFNNQAENHRNRKN